MLEAKDVTNPKIRNAYTQAIKATLSRKLFPKEPTKFAKVFATAELNAQTYFPDNQVNLLNEVILAGLLWNQIKTEKSEKDFDQALNSFLTEPTSLLYQAN